MEKVSYERPVYDSVDDSKQPILGYVSNVDKNRILSLKG